jgi:putative transcriptional regulator
VREFGSSSLSLAGSLLIAHPTLLDPNFRKSVLFLSTNDAQEGSFGLALNRPAGRTVGELLPEKSLGSPNHVPVFVGGPVAMDQLVFASFKWHPETRVMECQHHLAIDEAKEAAHDDQKIVRAFIGYAGWTKGQLEGELAQRAWLVQKPDPTVLELERCPMLWRDLTSSFGPWFRLVAEAPEDLSRN